jgi:hypothetical protein
MNAEKQFYFQQYCDGQDVYEVPEPYEDDGDACPAREKLLDRGGSVAGLTLALKMHSAACAVCKERRAA